jgi:formamidopyrimidine-DNA glycosylase
MPELPDIVTYVDCLRARFVGKGLQGFRLSSPFLLRTFEPSLDALRGARLVAVEHQAKRLVLEFEGPVFAVIHLMVAGRLKLAQPTAVKLFGELIRFDFGDEALVLTEVSKKKRASLHLFRDLAGVHSLDRGGVDPFSLSCEEFERVLKRENRTLKRALTDPRIFSGIGNAYSDEILFWAELSPITLTSHLAPDEVARLYVATRHTLRAWIRLLGQQAGAFPEKVTAFRPEMAVHGRFKQPCRICGAPIAHIVYKDNETNYCPRCQTGGRILADRAMSRLLKGDFPRTLEEMEGE